MRGIIMPDGEIIGTPERPVLFSGRSSAAAGYTVAGTSESWRNSVARLAYGNYAMMTGIAAALAAPLIGLADRDGFGIHFMSNRAPGKQPRRTWRAVYTATLMPCA